MNTPNFDKINPVECVYAKVRRLHRLIDSVYQKRLKEFDLKGSMLSILFVIGKNAGINQKDLADRLVLDQSTVSRDVKKLISKGWINVSRANDTRYSELELSKDGFLLLEKVSPIWEKIHCEVQELIGVYSLQQLDSITNAVRTNLDYLNK